MKLGLMFGNVGPFATRSGLEMLVRCCEDAGLDSLFTVEHVVVPRGYESEYPYDGSGRMPGDESAPIPDPILPLAFAAAISDRLRLGTGVLILPQRHPAYVAKELATLDQLSGGRAILGVGIGWLAEEFEVLGVPFRERAARTEESIRAVRSLWRGGEAFEGRFHRWGVVESNPKPLRPQGVPIWVGGHVEGAARRAARVADGFFPAMVDPRQLEGLLTALRDECGKIGRDPAEIEISVGGMKADPETLRVFAGLGVERFCVAPPAFDAEGLRRNLGELRERAAGL